MSETPAVTESGAYLGGPPAEWVELLASSDPIERRLGAYALGEVGPAAASASSALAAAARDETAFVRVWAAWALARAAPERAEAVATLAAGADAEQDFVRSLAAWLLGRLGPAHPGIDAALPALHGLREDPDPSVRQEAVLALERLEREDTLPRPAHGP